MRTSNFPPPDSYNPEYKVLRSSEPKWGFGSSTRNSFGGGVKTPAPGTYNVTDKNAGPTYQMGLKLDGQSAIAHE